MLGRRRGRSGRNRRVLGWICCGVGFIGLLMTVPVRAWLAVLAGSLVLMAWNLLTQS